jgi:hypothetical protein
MKIEDEPATTHEALQRPDRFKWRQATEVEIKAQQEK